MQTLEQKEKETASAPTEDNNTKPVRKTEHKTVNFRDVAESKRDVVYLSPVLINVKEGFNIRQDFGDMCELEKSIAENGVLKPLDVFQENGQIFLVDGHRRFAAVQTLLARGVEIKSVPCIPEQKGISQESRLVRMFLSSDGKPLTMIEQGEMVQRLIGFGWTPKQIAIKLGRTEATISNLKQLISLPKEVLKEVENETFSASTAIELNRAAKGDTIKLKEKIKAAKEMANSLGKKKVTKKTLRGESKRNKSKDRNKVLIALLELAIEAISSPDEAMQAKTVESIQSYIDGLSLAVK